MSKKRKTREQKIKAGLRRQMAAPGRQENTPSTVPTFRFVKREFDKEQAQIGSLASKLEKQENTIQTTLTASTITDLRKTFLIASVIFLSEAMLYWLWK